MEKIYLKSREDVEGLLAKLAIQFTTVEHPKIMTIKEGLEVCGSLTGNFVKNLYIKDKKDNYYLLSALHNTETPFKTLGKLLGLGSSGLRAAPVEKLQEHLQVVQGAVTPFALANDHENKAKLLLDENLLKASHILLHPMINTATTQISTEDFFKFLDHIGRKYQVLSFAETKEESKEVKAKAEESHEEANIIGIVATKEGDFSSWYSEVITKGGMIEYYEVSGCYILRPWAFAIWEEVHKKFDADIKKNGVKNAYFPMFVSERALNTEKSHIEGFAPEVAWVTKSGSSNLEKPIAIRPTSETIMYPAFSKWIRSHRDLPLKINQWCSVVRWEFKHPTPFLRTREFLWQEGHTAHATVEEASEQVLTILDMYASVYEDLLAVPVIKGYKSEVEKFAGGYYTTTIESIIPHNGRGVQCATSHNLGQNFSKMFDIWFEDQKETKQFVWQTSWGVTTRSLGVMVMWHGDNKGLVLPPRVAATQVIVIPIITKKLAAEVVSKCKEILQELQNMGIRAEIDERENYHPGWKFNHWELMGVPLRLELGPIDIGKKQVKLVARYNKEVIELPWDKLSNIPDILEGIHKEMLGNSKKILESRVIKADNWEDFLVSLNKKNIVLTPWCTQNSCEETVSKRSGEESKSDDEEALTGSAKTLCIPFEQEPIEPGTKCFHCGSPATKRVLWGRSY